MKSESDQNIRKHTESTVGPKFTKHTQQTTVYLCPGKERATLEMTSKL